MGRTDWLDAGRFFFLSTAQFSQGFLLKSKLLKRIVINEYSPQEMAILWLL